MNDAIGSLCSVEECENLVKHVGLCGAHYKRRIRYGDENHPVRKYSPANPSKRVCESPGCTQLEDGSCARCKLHDTRFRRTGTFEIKPVEERNYQRGPNSSNWNEQGSYFAVHTRLKIQRQPARNFWCVDCGGDARQWSYDGLDRNEQKSEYGPFSTDLDHYVPRCVSCHKKHDLARIRKARA